MAEAQLQPDFEPQQDGPQSSGQSSSPPIRMVNGGGNSDANPGQSPQIRTVSGGSKPQKKIIGVAISLSMYMIPLILGAALFGVFYSMLGKDREPTPNTSALAGNYTCKSWSDASAEASKTLQSSANEFKINPALLGAIHLQENGGKFLDVNSAGSSGLNGHGPFQFLQSTWDNEIRKAFSDFGPNDWQDYAKSSRAAAYKLSFLYKSTLKLVNEKDPSNSELVVKGIALGYNRGSGCEAAAFTGTDYSREKILAFIQAHPKEYDDFKAMSADKYTDIAMNYMDGVWKYFSDLSGSCSQIGGPVTACGVSPVDTNLVQSSKTKEKLQLMPPARDDFNLMASEFQQKTSKKLGILSMFRTKEEQIKLCGSVLANGKCSNPNANPPGKSMHEAGLAIDIDWKALSPQEYETFKQIASKYNFVVARVSGGNYGTRECWHFDYTKTKYSYSDVSAAISTATATNCN